MNKVSVGGVTESEGHGCVLIGGGEGGGGGVAMAMTILTGKI